MQHLSNTRPRFDVAARFGLIAEVANSVTRTGWGAPLVGVVLIAELTGAYSVLVPAILTCLFANIVAAWLGGRPIYEVLLERTLVLAGEKKGADKTSASDDSPQIGGWDQR